MPNTEIIIFDGGSDMSGIRVKKTPEELAEMLKESAREIREAGHDDIASQFEERALTIVETPSTPDEVVAE